MLYEMLTGRKAFEGRSQASLIAAIMTADAPAVSALQPLTPPSLDRIIRKCLIKDPEDRWQSARDLTDELKWIAEGGGSSVAHGGAAGKQRLHGRRERLVWASVCLLLLAATIYIAWFHYRAKPQPVPVVRSSLLPPPNLSFVPYNFAIAPDGNRLAFVGVGANGRNSLWLRTLDSAAAQQVNGTEGAMSPFWSPDSRHVGFFGEGKLKILDIAGGTVIP